MKTLKTAVIRLAYANPDLRSKLLPLLREAGTGRLDPEMFRILKKGAGMVRGGNLTSLEVLPSGSISLYGFTGDGRHGYEGEFGYEVTYYVGVDGEGYGGYLRGEIQPDNGMGSNRDVFYQYVTFPANASAADVAAILQPVWTKTWKAAEKMASKSVGFEDYTPPSPRRGPHPDSLEGHPGVRRRRSAVNSNSIGDMFEPYSQANTEGTAKVWVQAFFAPDSYKIPSKQPKWLTDIAGGKWRTVASNDHMPLDKLEQTLSPSNLRRMVSSLETSGWGQLLSFVVVVQGLKSIAQVGKFYGGKSGAGGDPIAAKWSVWNPKTQSKFAFSSPQKSAGCEKLPDALREQCEKKVEEGEKSDKTASSAYEILGMLGIGFTQSAKVYSQIEETDEQTAELLGEVISELSKYLTLGRGQLEALKRIQSLFENYRKWDSALIRNNVFKAANSMGMRLPSGMFASQAD